MKRSRPSFGFGWGVWKKQDAVPATPAPSITSSADPITVAEDAAVGTVLATFSIANGSGTYSWFLVDGGVPAGSATTLHDIGSNQAELRVASLNYETYPELNVSVQADNGVDTPITQPFVVTVTDVEEASSGIVPVLAAIGAI